MVARVGAGCTSVITASAPVALDLADAERSPSDEAAVLDRELVAVERADGRAGGAVALGVVLAAVARAAEARRRARDAASRCRRRVSTSCLVLVDGPFGCTGQPRWTQRLERIVKLGCRPSRGRCCGRRPCAARPRPASGSAGRSRSRTRPREVLERAEVDVVARPWSTNAGSDREAEHGQRDERRRSRRRGRASRPRGTCCAGSARARAPSRGAPAPRAAAGAAAFRLDLAGSPRYVAPSTSRIQRKPKTTAITRAERDDPTS